MTHDPYKVEKRKALTDKQRLRLFIDRDGLCCICGGKINAVNERWIDEHIAPLWLDGDNELSNRAPAHEKCARAKTDKEATERAKGRRVAERHFGAKRSTRPMIGSRASGYKKKMDGTVVKR